MRSTLLVIAACITSFSTSAQNDVIKIEATFYVNNEPIEGVKYYLIQDDGKAYSLPCENNRIVLKDTFTTEGIPLLAIVKNHKVVFPIYYYRQSDYVKIYYDSRLLGNKTKKKLGIGRWRYLFRKEYYIDNEGFDDLITVFKPQKAYNLVETD